MADRQAMTGTLYGLGVGPGDPELVTLKAARILAQVPVIAFPQAPDGDSMARRIVAGLIPDAAEILPLDLPMCTDRAPGQAAYIAAATALTVHLDAGRNVAVLCEGDPFLYGSFMYFYDRLVDHYPVEVVSGVSSLTAAAAALGRPLAARNDILAVIPATVDVARLRNQIAAAEAVAILKVGRHFDKVRAVLRELHLIDQAFLVTAASCVEETVVPLAELPDGPQPYFSIILVYKGAEGW
jgi:precorrin-2/cobalt-factor-2 C20-methyltransferase